MSDATAYLEDKLSEAAAEIERLITDLKEVREWAKNDIQRLTGEIERLRAERDAYKGTLRYLAGEGVTAARRALEGK